MFYTVVSYSLFILDFDFLQLTNYDMYKNLEFIAISGPTYDELPAFQWSKADFAKDCPHYGHPDVYKFDPIYFNGTLSSVRPFKAGITVQ